jgi:hypothetical protein
MKDAQGHGSNKRGTSGFNPFMTAQDYRRKFTDVSVRQGATSRGVTNAVRERQQILAGVDERRFNPSAQGAAAVPNALRNAPSRGNLHTLGIQSIKGKLS